MDRGRLFDNGACDWSGWLTDLAAPSASSSALNGLGNVGFTGLIGGFADYWALPWLRSRVEVMEGFGGATGIQTNLSMDAVVPLSTALTWSGGPRARYVTSGLESPYFSITQAQSAASDFVDI
jgi:outer membrane protein